MDAGFSGGGERVDLVDEDDALAHGLGSFEDLGEPAFRFTVVFRHDGFERHVNQRDAHLLRDDFGARRLPTPRRPFE